ncbi:multiple epidermal growth factor-like domains protein 10 [Ostrea edulis]|uniref:multiple epidermal growth factor-like domains protein 10 n=1 Tax=Ostrea edulis TaxID=37623 RepID=UPI0024AF34F2|nr:multiple epidermal growth factor-like domains protein 10 [Ostrea edulis]
MSKIIFIALLRIFSTFEGKCRSPNGVLQCCADHVWNNETKQCIECSLGYHGENCQMTCPYPSFGRLCQSECKCDNALCDVAIGCTPSHCETGYFGKLCQHLCPYPSFGRQCNESCLCDKDACNPINGCSANTKHDNQHDEQLQLILTGICLSVAMVVLCVILGLYTWKVLTKDSYQSGQETTAEETL